MSRFHTFILMMIVVSAAIGCNSSEPTVVMPTETYEPTATEQANAEREANERELEN